MKSKSYHVLVIDKAQVPESVLIRRVRFTMLCLEVIRRPKKKLVDPVQEN